MSAGNFLGTFIRGAMATTPEPASRSVSMAELSALNQELAALVNARVPLEAHLRAIGNQGPRKQQALLERIAQRMEAGDDLPTALDTEGKSLPDLYPAVVRAGLKSGRLAGALEGMVKSCSRLEEIRHATGLALIYPLLVLAVAGLLILLLARFVLPSFGWVLHEQLAFFRFLPSSGTALGTIAIGIPFVLILLAIAWWIGSGRAVRQLDCRGNYLTWIPFAGRVCRDGSAATLAELLHLLVSNSVPLPEALRLAGDATGNAKMAHASREMAESLSEGFRPQTILQSQSPRDRRLPPLVRLALAHADRRPLLERGLQQAATIYRERALRTADWVSEYMPILLTAAVGCTVVLALALALFWPYVSALYEISQPNWH